MSNYSSSDVRKWLGYLTINEYDALWALASSLEKGAVIVNIGAGGGTSGLLFAEVLGTLGTVYTVDIQDGSNPRGCLQGERRVFANAGLSYLKNKHWFQIHGDSKDVGREWSGPPVDMLFIDGLHTYAGCSGDIINWYNHVSVGGFIVIHDYEPTHVMKKEVYAATNDLLLDIMETVEIVDCMIVLRKVSGEADVHFRSSG